MHFSITQMHQQHCGCAQECRRPSAARNSHTPRNTPAAALAAVAFVIGLCTCMCGWDADDRGLSCRAPRAFAAGRNSGRRLSNNKRGTNQKWPHVALRRACGLQRALEIKPHRRFPNSPPWGGRGALQMAPGQQFWFAQFGPDFPWWEFWLLVLLVRTAIRRHYTRELQGICLVEVPWQGAWFGQDCA